MTPLMTIRVLVALVLATTAGHALAAQPSGTVVAVIQQASVDGATGRLVLQQEALLFSGDRIVTDVGGEAQIRFRDDTRLVVGPNSSMVIDAFVFNDDDTAREISINALRGAFRFITGNSNKDAYSITTPTATIGVRGTEFDVAVEGATGVTRVVNFDGVARVCRRRPDGTVDDPRTGCVELRDPCTLSIIRPKQQAIKYSGEDNELRVRQLRFYFPYVRNQESLLSDFRVNAERCLTAEAIPGPGEPPPGPGPVPPEPPSPIGPDKPDKPAFVPPSLPSPANRHDLRDPYDHGPVFR